MNTDPGILCFQHCGRKVFCFELPELCPICQTSLHLAQFQLLPFRVPYPFSRAAQHPCCVVMKPTVGDFLNDYYNSMDLHIGLTDSSGSVVEFDKNGVERHNGSRWNQCLVLDGLDESWADHWDDTLDQIMHEDCWTPHMYNERGFNCYTFVLNFLQRLGDSSLSKAASSKTYFCEKFIVPRTTAAGKYISMYRKLRGSDFYVHTAGRVDSPSYPESVPSR